MVGKVPDIGSPRAELTHTPKPSRLPLSRLLEAKMLNSQLGKPLRDSLFPRKKLAR
jgi:hypothetical protein